MTDVDESKGDDAAEVGHGPNEHDCAEPAAVVDSETPPRGVAVASGVASLGDDAVGRGSTGGSSTRRWQRVRASLRRLPHRRRALVFVVVAVVLIVALAIGGLRVWGGRDTGLPGWARSPAAAVQGYLAAVAEGHARDALAYLSSSEIDRTFLTDRVLARSHRLAPLTGIAVVSATDKDVTARYRLGGDRQTVQFAVEKIGGYWFVGGSPATVVVSVDAATNRVGWYGLPVSINGVQLPPGESLVTVFPGRYEITSDHLFVRVDKQFTAGGNSGRTTAVVLRPHLDDTGADQIRKAAQAQLDSCVAQHTFTTDCGFLSYSHLGSFTFVGQDGDNMAYVKDNVDWPTDATTISWSVSGPALPMPDRDLRLGLGSTKTSMLVAAPINIQLHCTWAGTAGEQSDAVYTPDHYVADITDPDHIVVSFVMFG